MPKNNDVAILDIGSRKLTVFVGEQGINNIFNVKGRGEALYGGFADGEFLEPQKLAIAVEKALGEAENSIKSRIKNLYIGVPGEFCTSISKEAGISFKKKRKVTEIDIQELYLSGNIKNNSYTLINSSPVYYTLDDNKRVLSPVGMVTGRLTGLLSFIFAENKFLTVIGMILDGLNISSYKFISSVLAEAMLLFEDKEKQALFVDIGYLTSTVALFQGEGLLYLKSFSAGGAHISADLMECLHISFNLAEKLKEEIRLSLDVAENEKYKVDIKDETADIPMSTANEIVSARVEMLASMIKKCLKDCAIPQNAVLYFTGGGISYIRGAKEILSAVLNRNVEIISPRMPQINKPHLSSAYGVFGLALKQANIVKKNFWSKIFG